MSKHFDFTPVAIVTDVHYRMSLALIRDLGEAGVTVITCEKESHRANPAAPALGSLSRHCTQHFWIPDDEYENGLQELCRTVGELYGCRPALLPVGAGTLEIVSARMEVFSSVSGLLIPSPEQLNLMNDKEQVSLLAREQGIPVPECFSVSDPEDFSEISYPCVIKPHCGEKLGLPAAQRYVIAGNPEDARHHYSRFLALSGEEPLVQACLSGAGLGCSVLAEDGHIIAAAAHRRLREYPVSGGPSSCCISVDPAPYLPWVEKLVRHTGYSGLAMFEFKEDGNGNAHLLEVNPRIWGTFPLTRVSRSGIPMAWLTLAWNRGNPESPMPLSHSQPRVGRKMIFCASDLMAAAGYAKAGAPKKSLGAFLDLLNPRVRDGLLEWRDLRPAMAYFASLLKKEKP